MSDADWVPCIERDANYPYREQIVQHELAHISTGLDFDGGEQAESALHGHFVSEGRSKDAVARCFMGMSLHRLTNICTYTDEVVVRGQVGAGKNEVYSRYSALQMKSQ